MRRKVAKSAYAQREESIASALTHEAMSWKQAQTAKIALIEQETAARQAAMVKETGFQEAQLQLQIDAAAAAAAAELAADGGNKSDPKYLSYMQQVNTLTQQQIQLVKQLQAANTSNGQQGAAAIQKETDALSPLAQKMKQVQGQFNQDFAQMAVSGKSFGNAMRQMSGQLLEETISYELKRMESFLMARMRETSANAAAKAMQTATNTSAGMADIAVQTAQDKTSLLSSAEKAAGKAWASAPNPIVGAIEASAAFVGVMAFEQGGLIPGIGAVPIIGHGGETVVTKALTDRVESSERGGGKGSGSQNTWNFSPTVHAMDAEGVDRVLAKHSSVFQRHIAATVRRMNK